MKRLLIAISVLSVSFVFSSSSICAQSTVFTYQGKLTDGSVPANGIYLMQFSLFDAATSGNQIGQTQSYDGTQFPAVQVTNGIFSVQLNFGSPTPPSDNTPRFDGSPRWLAISVRAIGQLTFQTLSPRQPVTSEPYSIRSTAAGTADTATNALSLGGIIAGQYVITSDPRMTDARSPSAGSGNYVQNGTAPQPSTNFNISGNGIVGGSLGIGISAPTYKLQVIDPSNTGLRVQTNVSGGTVASFGGSGDFAIDAPGVFGGRLWVTEAGDTFIGANTAGKNLWVNGTIHGDGSGLTNVTAQSNTNSNLLGSLRWDLLNQKTFAAGTSPFGIAFDGANIWVTSGASNNVSKLRLSDGAILGTFAAGTFPIKMAFDGTSVWITNVNSNNVTKLRASDGAVLGTFAVGTSPVGLAFDGTNIWVANSGGNSLSKLRASDGAAQATVFGIGNGPSEVAFDGANLWITSVNNSSVIKVRASDGVTLGTFTVGSFPHGIAFDGANVWIANAGSNNVTKLRASDGANLGTFAVGSSPNGVAFDGSNIWVVNNSSRTVTKLHASDGATLGSFPVGDTPMSVAFDGANMWVTDQGSNQVTRIPAFP